MRWLTSWLGWCSSILRVMTCNAPRAVHSRTAQSHAHQTASQNKRDPHRTSYLMKRRNNPSGQLRSTYAHVTPQPPQAVPDRSQAARVSDELLHRIWRSLWQEYFPERNDLDTYLLVWSTRPQRRVLASCNIRCRRVVVARELFVPSAVRWLAPVLYHELCHAVLGESVRTPSGRRMWHGASFRALEARHPDIPAMNLWIRSGGWAMAVRSARSRRAWQVRKGTFQV